MQTLALTTGREGTAAALEKAAAFKPQLVLAFAAPALWQDRAAVAAAFAPLKDAGVIGCTTAGEMSSGLPAGAIADESLSLLALKFDNTQVKLASAAIASMASSRGAGLSVAEDLKAYNLRGVVALCPGTAIDGSVFARAVASVVGPKVVFAGGMAGDGVAFKNPLTMFNGQVLPNRAVAFGIYGDHVQMRTGAQAGWRVFGLARRVTKTASNVLLELDGKPALALLENYLGDRAAGLPLSGLAYPFALLKEDDQRENGIIRMSCGVDRAAGGLVLCGEVAEGSFVRLMHADADLLVGAAGIAGKESGSAGASPGGAALLVSCVGRRLALAEDAGLEIEAATLSLGSETAYAGFYGYGAFGSYGTAAAGSMASRDLLNQTMMVTQITEGGA